ncbi:beta-1,3-galactosyltransferase 5 [Rhagoletis pomonella]|uniref:beta-1,3-galactosyltransferase 5 n=1 Tax=Rhagoletis pomonella TaxID=28610 RepID=UPI00177A7E59|nr:beta-1,3-galactosyltransferase 5 [Rhagoletis pomonella]
MRLRGRIAYKFLTLIVAVVIVVIICIDYFAPGEKRDEFLTHLPPLGKDLSQEQETPKNEVSGLDLSQLVNFTSFKYETPNNVCRKYDKELLAIIIVTSYAGHDELRAAHRQAIPQSKLAEMGMQRVFLLAALPPTEKFITQKQLFDEQERFGDLLQGNFQEAYRNLSYKHVMGLRWAATECSRAKFIIKIDDDIIYDVFHFRRYLESLEVQQPNLIASPIYLAGYVLSDRPPVRNTVNKWYVSKQDWPKDTYPAYLSGWLYITNPVTALRLVQEAQKNPFFWIDDTWVTGILREKLNIPVQPLNAWYSANAEFIDCCVRDLKQQSSYECEYFVGPNGGDTKMLVEFLHNVEKCYFDECSKRPQEKSLKKTCIGTAKHLLPDHGSVQVKQVPLR